MPEANDELATRCEQSHDEVWTWLNRAIAALDAGDRVLADFCNKQANSAIRRFNRKTSEIYGLTNAR